MAGSKHDVITASLEPLLSPGATIGNVTQPLRWSEFKAPLPGAVVHPATELDVSNIVKWAIERNVPFLTQNGGNGWASTFTLDNQGILIQMDKLKSVVFGADGTEVTIGGGALIADVVPVAYAKSSHTLTGTCNCVGALGAILGGGFSNLMGQYGLGVDDVLSLNVVKPNGQAVIISAALDKGLNDRDLFWAMRGAGPNFGIVTSAVLRAHPVPAEKLNAWTGPLSFSPDKLEAVITAIQNLNLTPEMALSVTILSIGVPTIMTGLFYNGPEAAGRLAFKSLLDLGPLTDRTAITPYTMWNAGSDTACLKGGRKPTFGVGFAKLDPAAWRTVYNLWVELVAKPDSSKSSILMNAVPHEKARTLPDSSSAYPFRRNVNFHATITISYTDPAFDAAALEYGKKARAVWQATDGLASDSTYINNAFGDESLMTIYGTSLTRLQQIKAQVDPHKRFNQWFPLS